MEFLDARGEYVQPLLALAAAAQFAHARHQQVGGGHGLAVVVHAHVEGLDLLGIVGDEHRAAKVLLGQVALVFGLQIAAPEHGVLELLAALCEDIHSLGVADAGKVGVAHALQAGDEALVHEVVQELQFRLRLFQHGGEDVLDHLLLQVHVLLEGGEGDLRLDHPELCGVAGGVGLLSPEGGTEGVDVAEGHGEGLAVELAGDGEVGGLVEEILAKVHLAVLGAG